MRLFGRELQLQWPVRAVTAGYPTPSDSRSTSSGGWPVGGVTSPGGGEQSLDDRVIPSDPRDLWFLSLPVKLQPKLVLNILRSGLGGDCWQVWQLLSQMLDTWPTFRMAQHQLREAVSYTKFIASPYCEEGKEPTPEAVEKAGQVERAMKGMAPDPFTDEMGFSGMVYDYCDAMLCGLTLTELIWSRAGKGRGTRWSPRAAAWVHPRHFTFTAAGQVSVFADTVEKMYPDTQLASWVRTGGSTPDQDKFVCSQFKSRSGSSLGQGLMRPLALGWSARMFNWEWALNTAKMFGSPFIDMTFKPGTSQADLDALDLFLRNAGPERRLKHPEGTVATIHPAQSLGQDNPQRWIMEEADRWCLYLLLGQSHTTMATPGKLGEEGTHADVKDERVMGLANWVARNPLRQFARAVLRVNWDNDEECPNIEPDFTKPLTSSQVSQLVTAITSSGVPVLADELYKKTGFTQPQPGDIVMKRGEPSVANKPMTDDEKFAQDLERHAAAIQFQEQAGVGQPVQGRNVERNLRDALMAATPVELDEVERLVVKAQKAGGGNGEWKAVAVKVKQIGERNRIRLFEEGEKSKT
jgi:phage gp29-like protein